MPYALITGASKGIGKASHDREAGQRASIPAKKFPYVQDFLAFEIRAKLKQISSKWGQRWKQRYFPRELDHKGQG